MEDYRRYLTEEGHPQRVVDLARQLDRTEALLRELVEAVEVAKWDYDGGIVQITDREYRRIKSALAAEKGE